MPSALTPPQGLRQLQNDQLPDSAMGRAEGPGRDSFLIRQLKDLRLSRDSPIPSFRSPRPTQWEGAALPQLLGFAAGSGGCLEATRPPESPQLPPSLFSEPQLQGEHLFLKGERGEADTTLHGSRRTFVENKILSPDAYKNKALEHAVLTLVHNYGCFQLSSTTSSALLNQTVNGMLKAILLAAIINSRVESWADEN